MRHATNLFSCWKCEKKNENFVEIGRTDEMYFRASGDLQAILDDDGSLTEQKTRNCIREVLKALDYLHRRNVAHLDIKPQNILLNTNNLEGKEKCSTSINCARP